MSGGRTRRAGTKAGMASEAAVVVEVVEGLLGF
jgi:hypothetical protein